MTAFSGTHPRAPAGPVAAGLDRWLQYAGFAALAATAASLAGRAAWLTELLTHFRFQLALFAVLLFAYALVRRKRILLAMAAAVGLANTPPLLPYVLSAPPAAEAAQAGIRIMLANVHHRSSGYARLLEQVRETDPDILGLVEVDRDWLQGLSGLESEFAWSVLRAEDGPWGLALYSDLPLDELPDSPYVENDLQTAIAVELEVDAVPLTLVLAHVRAPTSPASARLRNLQLGRLAEFLRADPNREQILLGDLNTTPWSPYYRHLAATAAMSNAARGFGYRATWPTVLGPLGIPIDHCLVSEGLRVRTFRTGSAFGSDHLPIVVELTPDATTVARAE